jgi:RHS repeat-associated protein
MIEETIFLEGAPVAVMRLSSSTDAQSPNLFHVFADHLGAPRVITDSRDSKIVWRWDNADPFGMVAPLESTEAGRAFNYNRRFPGQYYDKESNLHYNYYRDYDPQTGRYVQSDPIGLEGGINTYAYVENNPLNHIDPLGLEVEVGVRTFSPVPLRYVRHCFVRFNGNNGDTLSFDNQGVHADVNPTGRSILNSNATIFSGTIGKENDMCVRKEMNKCKGEDYDFTDYNCCSCVSNALSACGLAKEGNWPNWPRDASNPPYLPPSKK